MLRPLCIAWVILAACGPSILLADGSDTEGDDPSADGGAGLTSGASATDGADGGSVPGSTAAATTTPDDSGAVDTAGIDSEGETEDSGGDFLVYPDVPTHGFECDLIAQDCARGEKCMPYSLGGGLFEATACFPINANPVAVGEPCEYFDRAWNGHDNCGPAAVCWELGEPGSGFCKELCGGSNNELTCSDPNAIPDIGCQSCFCVCEEPCSPLAQDCPGDLMCVVTSDIGTCVVDASGDTGQYGDACEFVNVCDPGLQCMWPSDPEVCGADDACCLPVCDLDNPQCPDSLTCTPYYEDPDTAPPQLANLGQCL